MKIKDKFAKHKDKPQPNDEYFEALAKLQQEIIQSRGRKPAEAQGVPKLFAEFDKFDFFAQAVSGQGSAQQYVTEVTALLNGHPEMRKLHLSGEKKLRTLTHIQQ
jgi:hypothetical protein